jgi:hypothetical protein
MNITELEEWHYYCDAREVNNELLTIIYQIQFNKKVLCSQYFIPTKSDIKIHKKRFDRLLDKVVDLQAKALLINYHYTPQRFITIKESITKLRNYENKRISQKV